MSTDLERVRSLLLGSEYEELLRLKREFEDDGQFADHIARVVTEAIRSRASRDDSVTTVLAPTIDRAISGSINQDPHKLAESLYPIMGPAIRKSISETLQQMIENFNQLLEQSLSPQSLRWRFDAWRTGRTYTELVLLNTLEYQIDQVFLIHRETSLLISHVFNDLAERKDPDMVSSMFSAIQDFIEDSFSVNEGDVLDTLRLGDLTVVIQRGPHAVLAAVVRGRVPENLREKMSGLLENLHRLKRQQLMEYGGDPAVFAEVESDLRTILDSKARQDGAPRKTPWLAIVAIIFITGLIAWWQYQSFLTRQAQQDLITRLAAEPGLVVLHSSDDEGIFHIELLADPMATDPEVVAYNTDLVTRQFTIRPHLSLSPEIVLRRITRQLAPPEGVTVGLDPSTLIVSGLATIDWYERLDQNWALLAGVDSLDVTGLKTHDPVADEWAELRGRIQAIEFSYPKESVEVDPNSAKFQLLISSLRRANQLSLQLTASPVKLDIVGYTDETGTVRLNEQIGLQRAEQLKQLLVTHGVGPGQMRTFSGLRYEDAPINMRKTRIVILTDQGIR